VPGQYQQLIDGCLDVGIGRAALAPPHIALLLFRQDPVGSWCQPVTGSPGWRACRSRIWPPSRCCSPKKCGPRSSTSSPSRCAGRLGSPLPCTPGRWRASGRPLIWSPGDAACTACLYSCISALPGDHLAAPDRAGVLLPVVGAVAQGHGLRPRTRDHHLRASNVAAARLASDRRPYGKLNEPPRRIFVTIRAPPLHPPGAVVPYYGRARAGCKPLPGDRGARVSAAAPAARPGRLSYHDA